MVELSRRSFLTGVTLTGATAALAKPSYGALDSTLNNSLNNSLAATPKSTTLIAGTGTAKLSGAVENQTAIWSYNGQAPGPILRVKQGDIARFTLQNELSEASTIHWHGLRIKNNMDGVPFLTQPPVLPGQKFKYEFSAMDAGTYWYHPHVNSSVQVGRGLSGALIVEEQKPPEVDRDIVWVLDDWRIQKDGVVAPFGGLHDAAHAGRYGNVITINGRAGDDESGEMLKVRSHERIRLRLINVANARIFGLRFEGHDPWRIAVDGHPVEPQKMGADLVVVAPGGRIDLIIDMTAEPGKTFKIRDEYFRRSSYTLGLMSYSEAKPRRRQPLSAPPKLAANPVQKPDLANAESHEMTLQGGAMGGMQGASFKGQEMGLRELAGMGLVWAFNGKVIPPMEEGNLGEPMLTVKKGSSQILRWRNQTAFAHPMHLHGHSFHVIARNGVKLKEPVIMDTVLIQPKEFIDVAFVADNPGDWALHCHILEHAKSGMMGYLRVS